MENNENQEMERDSEIKEPPMQQPQELDAKRKKAIFKKWWFWLILASIVISIIIGFNNEKDGDLQETGVGPGSSSNKNDGDSQETGVGPGSSSNNDCSHSYVLKTSEATCTTGGYDTYKCSICKDIKTEYKSSLGHTTTEGTCSRCGKSFGTWKSTFYVDEFQIPTDEAYITNSNYFLGTFSNSATTNSKLNASILIDTDGIAIKLWEYGSQLVKDYSTTNYKITILDDAENKHTTTGTMYKNGDRIHLADWTLVNLLQNNKQLKIYIQENSSYGVNSTYLFTITNGNFNSVFSDFYYKYMN